MSEEKIPEQMTVTTLKEKIRYMTSTINQDIIEKGVKSTALKKELEYLQVLRSGKKQKYEGLRFWFKGKKKADLVAEYKELARFTRFDKFSEKAQADEEKRARKAYETFTENRKNLPVQPLSYDDFMNLRNFFGNVSKDLIEKFGYENVMEAYDEVSGSETGRVDIISAMHDIYENNESLTPNDMAILLRQELGLEV